MKDILRDYIVAFISGIYAGLAVLSAQKFVLESRGLLGQLFGSFLFVLFVFLFFVLGLAAVKIGVKHLGKKKGRQTK